MRKFCNLLISLALLCILLLIGQIGLSTRPVQAEEEKPFQGDERYRTYPFEKARLKKERVLLVTDSIGEITKIYHYNPQGKLDAIHLPQQHYSLIIEENNRETKYYIAKKKIVYRVFGGNLDNFDAEYAGSGGIADTLLSERYFKKIIKTTKTSVKYLTKALNRYEKQANAKMTAEEFAQPVTSNHPLMSVNGMKLTYFFDGHGQRLELREALEAFHVTSPTLADDLQIIDVIQAKLTGYKHIQRVIIGVLLALLLLIIILLGIFFKVINRVIEKFRGKLDLSKIGTNSFSRNQK